MKVYSTNREGKHYPVFEVDAIDFIQQYLDGCDMEQFIYEYIGHERFLEYAVAAIKDAYTSKTSDPDILKAQGELAQHLGFKYAKAMADDFAFKSATDEYYARKFNHLYRAINIFASEENPGWYNFWAQYCLENPQVYIGDKDWAAMQDTYRKEVWHRVESRMSDVLNQNSKQDIKKALWWFEEYFNNFKAFAGDDAEPVTVIHKLLQQKLSED